VGGAIVHLIAFPGAGKYTIAKQLAERAAGERWVVVDNHYVNNTIFGVLDVDGITPLDPQVWTHIRTVRNAVLDTIRTLSPPDWSFVFTNVLFAGDPGDEAAPGQLAQLAEDRGAVFVPVVLRCEVDELVRRVTSPERRHRMKWVDADGVRGVAMTRQLIAVDHRFEHALDLDVTTTSPADAADAIRRHVAQAQASAVAASSARYTSGS
jgi:hypothetical protein